MNSFYPLFKTGAKQKLSKNFDQFDRDHAPLYQQQRFNSKYTIARHELEQALQKVGPMDIPEWEVSNAEVIKELERRKKMMMESDRLKKDVHFILDKMEQYSTKVDEKSKHLRQEIADHVASILPEAKEHLVRIDATIQSELNRLSAANTQLIVENTELRTQAGASEATEISLEDTTNQDVLDILRTLRDPALLNNTPSQICDTSTERRKCKVRLAAGLLLPMRFTGECQVFSGEIDLDFNTPLKELVKDHFTELLPAEPSLVFIPGDTCSNCGTIIDASHRVSRLGYVSMDDTSSMRFPRNFSAQKLEYIAGFKIGWTYNLLDHLRLIDTDNDLQLLLFHHVKQFDSLN